MHISYIHNKSKRNSFEFYYIMYLLEKASTKKEPDKCFNYGPLRAFRILPHGIEA